MTKRPHEALSEPVDRTASLTDSFVAQAAFGAGGADAELLPAGLGTRSYGCRTESEAVVVGRYAAEAAG